MKGHKFKLEAVLKLRKIKEDVCAMELGKIQLQINDLNMYKDEHLEDIKNAYGAQELDLKQSVNVVEIQKKQMLISGKREHIVRIEESLEVLRERLEEKVQELAKLKGDVKVIANMKEKSIKKYKKELNKKINENLEEQTQNWNSIKDII